MEWLSLYLPNYLLIFCRIASFFMLAPVFSIRNVPLQFKVGLVVFLSFIVFGVVGVNTEAAFNGEYVVAILRETLIGLAIGYIAYLFFTALQVAGSFVDLQMGFGIANVVDPVTGAQSPLIGNFKFFIAILLFLSFNGHHYLLMAIMDSYEWIPLHSGFFNTIHTGELSHFLIKSFITMFYLAFQMAAPLIAALFLVDVAFGILAKTAPQFNIFVVGFPVKIVVGFLILAIMVTSYLYLFQHLFEKLFSSIRQLFEIMGGNV